MLTDAEKKERKRAYDIEYRKAHRERRNAAKRAYYADNRTRLLRRNNTYNGENRERLTRSAKLWRQSHPERLTEYRDVRNAWLRAGDVSAQQLQEVTERYNSRCAYCGMRVKTLCLPRSLIGFDHVIPRAKGGRHTVRNIVTCCHRCNTRKGAQTSPEWTPKVFTAEGVAA